MSPEKFALAAGISTLILLSGQQRVEQHSFALTATTVQDPTHELFLEGTAPDNVLRPPASCKAHAAFPSDLSRISHHGFTPGFSPYRNTGAFRAHPD